MKNNINKKNELSVKINSEDDNIVVIDNLNNVETLDIELEVDELKLDESNISIEPKVSDSSSIIDKNELSSVESNEDLSNNEDDIIEDDALLVETLSDEEPTSSEDELSSDLAETSFDNDSNFNQKYNDRKEKVKEKVEDIKNKYEEEKQKINNRNRNNKETPNNLQQKRENVKEKWNNKTKNKNEQKNKPENKATNIKDRVKKRIKSSVKNTAINSEIGQKVLETKEKIDNVKKTIKTIKKIKATASVIGSVILAAWPIILAILVVIIIAITLMVIMPGTRGKADDSKSDYSKTDLKTLEKIKGIVEDYPSADASLAMSAVVYPYFDYLWSKKTKDLVSSDYIDELSNESFQDEELDYYVDTEDIEAEEKVGHDLYLEIFRKSSYRKNFKTLLKKLRNGEEVFDNYLKTKYFQKETAYKSMTEKSPDASALMESMLEDIKNNKSLFVNYVFENAYCATTLSSAGTVELDEMLKGNILVDVKVPSCTSGAGVWDCESVYDTPISLKQYVFGGTYEEFNSMDVEKTAAQMLAIKSYIVQRGKNMGWGIKQDQNGNYVVTARNNTNDLVYCDVDLGCKSGNTQVGEGNAKRDPITSEQRAVFESAWEKVSDKYIYDNDNKKTVGSFCQSRSGACDFCIKGSCLAHQELDSYTNTSYEAIIGMQYSNYAIIQIEGDFASAYKANNVDCSNGENVDIDDSNFVYYAQTDYSTDSFCGMSPNSRLDALCPLGNTICSHGCGVTSMAMVTATLTQNYSINPLTINKEVRPGTDCGSYGTRGASLYPYIANKYGLTYSSKPNSTNLINDIKTALDEGALIITSVCGGLKINKRYTYKGCGGHFIVIRGYEGDSVIISDPYQNSMLKRYKDCLNKSGEKCTKHKMNFNTFYEDLRAKGGALHIIKRK